MSTPSTGDRSTDQPAVCGPARWPLAAILAIVFLRLTVGWHFFSEGRKKIDYDASANTIRISETTAAATEGFLSQAKGPLAGFYQSQLPGFHNWQELLATPQQWETLDEEEKLKRDEWFADYEQRRSAAAKELKEDPAADPSPIEFPPFAPYRAWAEQVADDWRQALANFIDVDGLNDEQRAAAAEVYVQKQQQLADYLRDESVAIERYQHELWRLKELQETSGAANVPFLKERVASKEAELRTAVQPWLATVRKLEANFHEELRDLLTDEQRESRSLTETVDQQLTSDRERRFGWVNLGVTVLTVGVGACLILGLFTRLACVAGGLFLLSVISTQPPWVAGAAPIYNPMVEFASLTVLFATAAGRWAGLDFFLYSLLGKCCRRKER